MKVEVLNHEYDRGVYVWWQGTEVLIEPQKTRIGDHEYDRDVYMCGGREQEYLLSPQKTRIGNHEYDRGVYMCGGREQEYLLNPKCRGWVCVNEKMANKLNPKRQGMCVYGWQPPASLDDND